MSGAIDSFTPSGVTGRTWSASPVFSDSPTSWVEFALRPPDAGQRALDERVKAMTPARRAEVAYQLRRQAFVLVNEAADEAGPMSELDRATFILRRLYPEFSEEQLASMRRELARREAAGGWDGFSRPVP
jgi:hypothetical protein